MDWQNQENDVRVLKKGSEANFIQKIYRYYGFLLPVFFIVVFLVMWYVGYKYYALYALQSKIQEANTSYAEAITANQWLMSLASNYGKTLNKYNDYTSALVNFPILFKTIEKYIPKEMERSSMKIDKQPSWEITVSINWKVEWYDSYLSLLTVVDKCNFMDPKVKDDFLSLSKVELSADGKNLAETKSLALNFVFNMQKNKVLWMEFYKNSLKKFDQFGNYIYLNDITTWNKPDIWSENGIDYKDPIKAILTKKDKFSKDLSDLAKIDINWFYMWGKAGNFISEYKDQTKVLGFLVNYFQEEKVWINVLKSDIFDDGKIKYKGRKDTKDKDITDLKAKLDARILEIDKEISYLMILQRYNEYLGNNHQLDTFENIKKKNPKEADKTIATYIKDFKILEENDVVLEPFIWKTQTEKEKSDKMKQAYVELFNFAKDADKKKLEFLDVKKKYIDNYYKNYYSNHNFDWFYEVIKSFTDNGFDEWLFSKISYKSFNFSAENTNANFSYKKRFYLTLKNDPNTRKYLSFISNSAEFSKWMNEYEDFTKQEDDLITYNNSKINCLERDIKTEIKEIYGDILSEQTQKTENDKKTKELNIIINTLQ